MASGLSCLPDDEHCRGTVRSDARLRRVPSSASAWQVTLFSVVFCVLCMLWYAPFFAWVGGLSTVFGRWSLPLAFVIPGLLAVIENISFFGQRTPRRVYLELHRAAAWTSRPQRSRLPADGLGQPTVRRDVYINRLIASIDWAQMGIGLAFAGTRDLCWPASIGGAASLDAD